MRFIIMAFSLTFTNRIGHGQAYGAPHSYVHVLYLELLLLFVLPRLPEAAAWIRPWRGVGWRKCCREMLLGKIESSCRRKTNDIGKGYARNMWLGNVVGKYNREYCRNSVWQIMLLGVKIDIRQMFCGGWGHQSLRSISVTVKCRIS